jgi:hypothetical protein
MALIKMDGNWNGKKAVTVDGHKAYEIKQLLIDMPADLDETKLTFLKAVDTIYFADGTRFPELPFTPGAHAHLTNEGIYQSSDSAIPNGDR